MLADANMVATESFNLGGKRTGLWLVELSFRAAHFVAHEGTSFLALFLATFVLDFTHRFAVFSLDSWPTMLPAGIEGGAACFLLCVCVRQLQVARLRP